MSAEPDFEYVLIDSTIRRGHADATGSKGGTEAQGIGRSRGSLTTRIHAAVDAFGLPARLIPTAGQHGDCPQAAALIDGLEGVGHVIADAPCDSGALRKKITDDLRAEAHIQADPSRAIKLPLDPTSMPSATRLTCVGDMIHRILS